MERMSIVQAEAVGEMFQSDDVWSIQRIDTQEDAAWVTIYYRTAESNGEVQYVRSIDRAGNVEETVVNYPF